MCVCLCAFVSVCVTSYFIANQIFSKYFLMHCQKGGISFPEPSIFGLCRLDAPFCPCYFADRKVNQDGRASFNVMAIITTLGLGRTDRHAIPSWFELLQRTVLDMLCETITVQIRSNDSSILHDPSKSLLSGLSQHLALEARLSQRSA